MTHLLVADSGGTKTDWLWLQDDRPPQALKTRGLNPNLVGPELIRDVLATEVKPWLHGQRPNRICLFGAGLSTVRQQNRVTSLVRAVFPETLTIRVETDILGAAYACLGGTPGIAGILGTGSVAFRYDGRRISERKGGQGYLLGDEGGGTSIGRAFIRCIVDGNCPADLVDRFQTFSGMDAAELIPELYNHAQPHRFLAAQVPFLVAHQDHDTVRQLVAEAISTFLDRYLLPLKHGEEPTIFMGGVARAFESIILELCQTRGIGNAAILEEQPVNALARHLKNMAN